MRFPSLFQQDQDDYNTNDASITIIRQPLKQLLLSLCSITSISKHTLIHLHIPLTSTIEFGDYTIVSNDEEEKNGKGKKYSGVLILIGIIVDVALFLK